MELKCFVVVPPGAERWAIQELLEHGASEQSLVTYPGGIEFSTDAALLAHWHTHLKIPVRLLVRLYEGEVSSWDQLWRALEAVPWENYFSKFAVPTVHVSSRSSKLFHKGQLQERVQRWFKKRAKLSGGDVYLRLFRDQLTLSLDATGEPLFKRGAKQEVGKAPLRENLAHLMLKLVTQGVPPELISRYELVDPMAGSGTLLIEAMGGSLTKRSYAFESWPIFKGAAAPERRPGREFAHHLAVDKDKRQFEQLMQNLKPFRSAGKSVTWLCQDSLQSAPPLPEGLLGRVLVTNPPFGQRIKSDGKPAETLKMLLRVYKPWRAAFIAPASWKLEGAFSGYALMERLLLEHGGLKVQMLALRQEVPLSLSPISAEVAPDEQVDQD